MWDDEKGTAAGGNPAAVEGMRDGIAVDAEHPAATKPVREQAFRRPINWALHYAQDMGWYVFPGRKKDGKGKLPLVKWGRGLTEFEPSQDLRAFAASQDPALIKAWWERWPDAEIGIDTGRSGLIVLDVDVRDGKDGGRELTNLQALNGDLPPTLEQRTPSGGRQLVFASATQCRTLATKEGLDVRSRGGMIFVPSGRGDRAWRNWQKPTQAPDWLPDAFAPHKPEKTGAEEPGLWTVEDLEEALAQLDVEAFDCHDLWFRVMCAAHHATNGEGEDVFFDWCAGDGRYADDEAANRYRWHTLNAGKPGVTTHRFLMKLLRDPSHASLRTLEQDPNWLPRWERPAAPEDDFDIVEVPEGDPAKPGRFRLLSRAQLATLPPPRWLVRDMLPENALVSLYGEPGAGKSFVAVDLSLSVAHGMSWHERTVVPGPVLYVAGEGVAGMNARVRAWELTRQPPRPTGGWTVLPEAVNLADPKTANELARFVKEKLGPLRLIVVDTLARCTPGADENSAQDMGRFVAGCDALRKATGATVLVVHHSGKDSAKGMRGSTALLGAMDTTVRVTKDKEGRSLKVAVEKQKDAEPLMPLSFRMESVHVGGGPDEIRSSVVLKSAMVPAEGEDWGERPEGQVLKLAAARDGLSKSAFADVVAEKLGMSPRNAVRCIDKVLSKDQGSAVRVAVDGTGHRVWMECTEVGRKKVYKVRSSRDRSDV